MQPTRRALVGAVTLTALLVAACSSPPTQTALLSGSLEEVGGPAQGLPRPVEGTVAVTGRGISRSVHVGPNGLFSIVLRPGSYTVLGKLGNSICYPTPGSNPVRLVAPPLGSTALPSRGVTLVCSIP
jgi:hypothetical protein